MSQSLQEEKLELRRLALLNISDAIPNEHWDVSLFTVRALIEIARALNLQTEVRLETNKMLHTIIMDK